MAMLNNLLMMHLKLLRKEQLKKTAEAAGDLIAKKSCKTLKNFTTE